MSFKIFLVVAFVGITAATRTESEDVGENGQGLVRAVRQVEASSLYGSAIAVPGVAPQYTSVQLSPNSGSGRQQGSSVFGSSARLGGVRGLSSGSRFDGMADGGGQPQLIVIANPVAPGNGGGNFDDYYVPSDSPIQSAGPAQARFSSRQPAGQVFPDSRPIQTASPAAYPIGQPAGQAVGDFRPIQAAPRAPSNYWSGQPVGPPIPNLAPVQTAPWVPADYFTRQLAVQPISNFPPGRGAAGPGFADYFTGQPTAQGPSNNVPSGPASANVAAFNSIPNRLAGPAPNDYYADQPGSQAASGFTSSQSSGQFPRFANPGPVPDPALTQPLRRNYANIGRSDPNQASGFGVYPANVGYPGYPGYPMNSGSSGYPMNSGSSGYPINSGFPGYPEDPRSPGWKAKPWVGKVLSHCPTCGASKFQGH